MLEAKYIDISHGTVKYLTGTLMSSKNAESQISLSLRLLDSQVKLLS